MQQEILINWSPQETRVAVVENGAVQELHVERALERGLVGNVYLGKVARVLPGMQSAFIDIGLERAAFLHVADLQTAIAARGADADAARPAWRHRRDAAGDPNSCAWDCLVAWSFPPNFLATNQRSLTRKLGDDSCGLSCLSVSHTELDHFPGVDGHIGVHPFRIGRHHPAQRLQPRNAGGLQRTDGLHLPFGAVHAGLAAPLDDAEQPVPDGGVDAPGVQADRALLGDLVGEVLGHLRDFGHHGLVDGLDFALVERDDEGLEPLLLHSVGPWGQRETTLA